MLAARALLVRLACSRAASNAASAATTASDWSAPKPSSDIGGSGALPTSANVIVIGGGIIGTSIAYHLAKRGVKDTILLEANQLTSKTTHHSAGLCGCFGSLSETSIELRKYSIELYKNILEKETGLATGFMPVGFIEIATSQDRLLEYRRYAAFSRKCGVEVQELSPAEVKARFPLVKIDDVVGGFYLPGDGRVNPVDVTMAMAKGAKMHGARIFEHTPVLDVTTERGAVTGVVTAAGAIAAKTIVNCTGMYARQFAARSGVTLSNQAVKHYYLITDAIPEVDRKWPIIEDPSSHTYIRPEAGGLMVGMFEPMGVPWAVKEVPAEFNFAEIPPDWDYMAPFLERAMARVPKTLEVGVRKLFCGPESFTHDLSPLVGEAPDLRGYYVCAGLNSVGVLSAGGMGRLMATWIAEGRPDYDVTAMNVNRVLKHHATPEFRAARSGESLGLVYETHYPTRQPATGRGIKRSAIYERLAAAGAFFKDVSGWEGADWYAPPGVKPELGPLSWGRAHWFKYWAAEHAAARRDVIAMDMSFMAKFMVQGDTAGAALNRMSTANVDGPAGTITYTQWLDESGRMQADLTVTKLAADKFLVIGTDNMAGQVHAMLKRACRESPHAFVTDVSSSYVQLNVQGPRSRALLQAAVGEYYDLSNEAHPFRAVREIAIGMSPVLCARITYLGELGYELYIPSESALHVYDRLLAEGPAHGLRLAGLKALASCRMEKGYRDYGHDMDNTDRLAEVGLGFTVDLEKAGGFVGKEAFLAAKAAEPIPHKRLLQVLCKDPEPLMFHGEIVLRNGKAVGDIRAASYGHTLGGAVGLSMVEAHAPVNKAYLDEGVWEVDVAGVRYPAEVSLRPMYDPNNLKIKA